MRSSLLVIVLAVAGCGSGSPSQLDGGAGGGNSGTGGGNSGAGGGNSGAGGGSGGGSADAGDSYAQAVERDADALCRYDDVCRGNADGKPSAQCVSEVRADLTDVRAMLTGGDAGTVQGCIECMTARSNALLSSLMNSCAAPDAGAVVSACGAQKQACNGKP